MMTPNRCPLGDLELGVSVKEVLHTITAMDAFQKEAMVY